MSQYTVLGKEKNKAKENGIVLDRKEKIVSPREKMEKWGGVPWQASRRHQYNYAHVQNWLADQEKSRRHPLGVLY